MKDLAEDSQGAPAVTGHATADGLQDLMALLGAAGEGAWLRAMQRTGLTMPQMITLTVLSREGTQTVSALAERLRLTRGATSHLVDRLVRLRFVTREESADDRRQKRVELAAAGKRVLEQLRRDRHTDLSTAASQLTPETRAALEAAVNAARRELRAYVEARRARPDAPEGD